MTHVWVLNCYGAISWTTVFSDYETAKREARWAAWYTWGENTFDYISEDGDTYTIINEGGPGKMYVRRYPIY